MLTEAKQKQYPYLTTYVKLYALFSNNCTRKCKRKCVCQLRALTISDALFDPQFRPFPYWL